MRSNNSGAFTPKLVSIGPYHRGKSEDLKTTEELKWRLLQHYFSKVPNERLNHGLRKMRDLESQARACYSEANDLSSDEFAEMLLLDGCFIIQTFMPLDPETEVLLLINSNSWFLSAIARDLLLLENQLPYFIVEHLLDMLSMEGWNSSRLQEVVIKLFSMLLPFQSNDLKLPEQSFRADHLLHLFHQWISSIPKEKVSKTRSCCYKLSLEQCCPALSLFLKKMRDYLCKLVPYRRNSFLSKKGQVTIPNTTELTEAGVKIKAREGKNFLDISFCKDMGELEVPPICIQDSTNFCLANLVALEQCCIAHGMDVTHYVLFFSNIINTPRDAELLYQEGIVDRLVGDEEIASLFHKIGKNVSCQIESSYLNDVFKDLNAYRQSRWPRWRAKAVHDYFNNPWAIISLGAGVLLLGFAILQSVYSVLDYYKM